MVRTFLLFLFLLISCGKNPSENIPSENSIKSNDSSICSGLDCYSPPVDINWSFSKPISIQIEVLDHKNKPKVNEKVEIYKNVNIYSTQLPRDAVLIFRGSTNVNGKIILNHRIERGGDHLTVFFANAENNQLEYILFDWKSIDKQNYLISTKINRGI